MLVEPIILLHGTAYNNFIKEKMCTTFCRLAENFHFLYVALLCQINATPPGGCVLSKPLLLVDVF